ncbi:MAG: hypothetical protein DHS20C18_34090 [Saprospiraceae bacterium]|nr:MAG: hypothetical protein DHS20C18_34090 [Saprospiraceae bacterium]
MLMLAGLNKTSFAMRANLVIILFTTLIVFTSCTKESAFFTETIPARAHSTDLNALNCAEDFYETAYDLLRPQGKITIQLQAVNNTVDPNAEAYIVHFSDEFDFTNIQPSYTQQLNFTDGQGKPSQLSFQVSSFQVNHKSVDIHFILSIQQIDGLQLSESQSIVVEEVIVN